ncbi:hypothetical protein PROFUN_07574 [Planoprotostelium fungivorum]|uniref:Uncharacterized protein n=1 Tax=Planoprotostelium fungivorum TaxID=1890364 RepID=A0A2P6NLS8_9EUKA|nr:hypothetical protein PROFUN_07574 [Planoprotostelium fungivorum]
MQPFQKYTYHVRENGDIEWNSREWNVFVEVLLRHVEKQPPPPDTFATTRLRIFHQDSTSNSTQRQLTDGEEVPHGEFRPVCYLFRGDFLPSGNADGLFWKPSRGTVHVGGALERRYHYGNFRGMRIRRQVSFLEGSDWALIEYNTCPSQPIVRLSDFRTLPACDWRPIVHTVASGLMHEELENSQMVQNVLPLPPTRVHIEKSMNRQRNLQPPNVTPTPPISQNMGPLTLTPTFALPNIPLASMQPQLSQRERKTPRVLNQHELDLQRLQQITVELRQASEMARRYNQLVMDLGERHREILISMTQNNTDGFDTER